MQYQVTAEQILYTILKNDLPGICGVADAFAGKEEAAIRKEFPQWETQLYFSGLGSMDFDGGFTLDPEFLQAVTSCCQCSRILSVPVRRAQTQRELTVFFCESGTLALEQVQDWEYRLHTDCDPEQLVPAFLQLPAATGFSSSCSIDSDLIQRADVMEMICSGCDPDLAKLAADAASGVAGYANLTWIENGMANEVQTILYNEEGIVRVEVAYTWEQELMRLTPVDTKWVSDYVRSCADRQGG